MKEGKKKKAKREKRQWLKSQFSQLTPVFAYHCIGERKPGNRHITTCMLVDKNFNVIAKGVAFKSPTDQSNSKQGRQFALSRAKGALTFMWREQLVKSLGDEYTEYRGPAAIERVQRMSVWDTIRRAEIIPTMPVEHKVVFRPKYFTSEEKYVLGRYTEARKGKEDGDQKEDGRGKGRGTSKAARRAEASGSKYRVRRVNADTTSAKRESA